MSGRDDRRRRPSGVEDAGPEERGPERSSPGHGGAPERPAPDPPTADHATDIDTTDRPAGRRTDHASPEAVVQAVYDVLSGPAEAEEPRDWNRLRSITLPGATFLITRWPDAEGEPAEALRLWDVEGFIADAKRFYRDDGFWETELWSRTERFGSVAHVLSTYESRVGEPESDVVGRGVNSFQLVRRDGRWWLASTVWDVETPTNPIPEAYLSG